MCSLAWHLTWSLGSQVFPLSLSCPTLLQVDLLPKVVGHVRLEQWVRRRARAAGAPPLAAVSIVSSLKVYGIRDLSHTLCTLAGPRGDVWVIGAQNAGKSSLINALGKVNETRRPALTEAGVPGTTVGVVPLDGVLPNKVRLFDTPGLLHPHQATTRLTADELRLVLPRKPLSPRTYRTAVGQSVHVGGLARVDVLAAPGATIYLTVWASADVVTHLGKTDTAQAMMEKHCGSTLVPPDGDWERVATLGKWQPRTIEVAGDSWERSSVDVALSGVGWVGIGLAGEAKIRVWTWQGIGVTLHEAMVYDFSKDLFRPGFAGVKVQFGQVGPTKKKTRQPMT